jgi:prophage antirepressor-like protein
MKELQVIEQREVLGKEFRIYGDVENPLFLAKDVATWIEHLQPTQMVEAVDDNEKLMCLINTSGQNRNMWFLTEDGLYEVLMQSRKPIAKEFKRQVKQILKDIRKHGMYATPQKIEEMLMDPDTMIKTLQALKLERSLKEQALKTIEEKDQQLEVAAPKVNFYDSFINSNDTISIAAFAKTISSRFEKPIGQNRLFNTLRENKALTLNNEAPQHMVERGFMVNKISKYTDLDGKEHIYAQPRITTTGFQYILGQLVKRGVLKLKSDFV